MAGVKQRYGLERTTLDLTVVGCPIAHARSDSRLQLVSVLAQTGLPSEFYWTHLLEAATGPDRRLSKLVFLHLPSGTWPLKTTSSNTHSLTPNMKGNQIQYKTRTIGIGIGIGRPFSNTRDSSSEREQLELEGHFSTLVTRLLWISVCVCVCTSVELVPSCSRFQQSNKLIHWPHTPKPRWPKNRTMCQSLAIVPVLREIQSRNIHSSRQEGNRALCRPWRTWPTRESAGKAEASLTCPLLGSSRSADASETLRSTDGMAHGWTWTSHQPSHLLSYHYQ